MCEKHEKVANCGVLLLHAFKLCAERLDELIKARDLALGGFELELDARVAAVQLALSHEHLALKLARLLAGVVQLLLPCVVLVEQQLVLAQQSAVVVRVLSCRERTVIGALNVSTLYGYTELQIL